MREAFEQSVDNIDGTEQGHEDKEWAMVRVKVRFVIDRCIG